MVIMSDDWVEPREQTYTYDDYRQDQLAEEGARLFDEHEWKVAEAGGVCDDPLCPFACHRERIDGDESDDADLPF